VIGNQITKILEVIPSYGVIPGGFDRLAFGKTIHFVLVN
jgi:hypothetical protein